jgi:biotin carboxyl carrier protein
MMRYYVQTEERTLEIEFEEQGESLRVRLGGEEMLLDLKHVNEPSLYSLILDNQSHEVFVEEVDGEYDVLIAGELFRLQVQDEWARRLANIQRKSRVAEGDLPVKAPMPGAVLSVEVEPGQQVKRGQGVVILGAMKMENQIKAPRDGVVKSVNCEQGQTVEQGRVLLVLA